MESLIVIVGFLGAGKTTLLKKLIYESAKEQMSPFVILNDYLNANLDAQQFMHQLTPQAVEAISGSCICCDGLVVLRNTINQIPEREKAITLIEANGTTDACALMGFLGVGLKDQFRPPIQLSVVDLRHWQKRGPDNELEANQVQVSSMIVLNYVDQVDDQRKGEVVRDLKKLNPSATVVDWDNSNILHLLNLSPSTNQGEKMDHAKSHWSACSVDLPDFIEKNDLESALDQLPNSILRVKGCTKFSSDSEYFYFERLPGGEISIKPFHGKTVAGSKLLAIGPGSDPDVIIKELQSYPSLLSIRS